MKWLAIILIASLSGIHVSAEDRRSEIEGTTWERLTDSEVGARLAWQQVQCFRLALSAHEGTASDEQREALYLGGVANLKQFVRNARAGNFPERPNVPMGMTLGGEWRYDTVDFAAGRLFEYISGEASDPIYNREWSPHFKDDKLENYGEAVPSDEWSDRATLIYVKEGCPTVAAGTLVCHEALDCRPND